MKKFLASVGHAQLIGKKNGQLYHIADVQTLTESSLSFSSSMEDVRAGQGAKLYGRFSHTTGMAITLTDAMFDLNYIALQVGAEIEGNATAFYAEECAVEGGKITLSKEPKQIGNACGLDAKIVWVRKVGCGADTDWTAILEDKISGSEVDLSGSIFEGESRVCVRYFVDKPEARMLSVSANFIPAEMILILTTKLFAGDANAVETGKAVGYITVKVPRFQLDGSFDLNMAMTSASTTSLSGTALAVADGTCDDNGIYAEIIEVEDNSTATTNMQELNVADESLKVGETPVVYGVYMDGHMSILNNAELTFEPVLSDGKFAQAGSQTVSIDSFTTTVTVEA